MAERLDHIPFPRQPADKLLDSRGKTALHDLYVAWAMRYLSIAMTAMRELDDASNCHASRIAMAIREEVTRLVLSEPAYMEAAARLSIGESVPGREDSE